MIILEHEWRNCMSSLTCVVRNKNGKVLTDDELRKTVIDVDLYYKIMATVISRMDEDEEVENEIISQSF